MSGRRPHSTQLGFDALFGFQPDSFTRAGIEAQIRRQKGRLVAIQPEYRRIETRGRR